MKNDATGGAFTNTSVTLMVVSTDGLGGGLLRQLTDSENRSAAPLAAIFGTVNVGFSALALLRVTDRPLGVLPRYVQCQRMSGSLFGVDLLPSSVTTVKLPPVRSGTVWLSGSILGLGLLQAAQVGCAQTEKSERRAIAHPRREARRVNIRVSPCRTGIGANGTNLRSRSQFE